MLILLAFFLVMDGGGPVKYTDTDIFQPLKKSDVAIGSDGDVFIVHFSEAKILHYNASGEALEPLGGKGQGPGELQAPVAIDYRDGRLYVTDLGSAAVTVYGEDGTYLERISIPGRMLVTAKFKGGWLYANWRMSMDPTAPVEVFLADNSFKQPVRLLEWERQGSMGFMRVESGSGGRPPAMPYNPVRDQPFMAISPDGRWGYISQRGTFKISVLDLEAKKVVHTILREEKPAVFNEEWGMERFKEFEKQARKRGGGMAFEPNLPEFFPVVRNLWVAANGRVVVEKWTSMPEDTRALLVLDREGGDQKLPYLPENEERVAAIRGENAYITLYDADTDQAELLRVPTGEIDRVAAEHPVVFDGFAGRLIVKGN